jgi:hypothetical protein
MCRKWLRMRELLTHAERGIRMKRKTAELNSEPESGKPTRVR